MFYYFINSTMFIFIGYKLTNVFYGSKSTQLFYKGPSCSNNQNYSLQIRFLCGAHLVNCFDSLYFTNKFISRDIPYIQQALKMDAIPI